MGWRWMGPGVASTLVVALVAFTACGEDSGAGGGSTGAQVAQGEALYQQTCAACHGQDLRGTDSGPALLDVIYAPNHHPDSSFHAAVQNGVVPHHWDFGPMPPQPAVSTEEIAAIVAYVRAEQREAGITEDPSH